MASSVGQNGGRLPVPPCLLPDELHVNHPCEFPSAFSGHKSGELSVQPCGLYVLVKVVVAANVKPNSANLEPVRISSTVNVGYPVVVSLGLAGDGFLDNYLHC